MSDSNITKLALADALKSLMAKKPFEKISVGDIVEHCQLTRQTFYYHFQDKYDLMNWVYYTETVRFMSGYDTLEHWTEGLVRLCRYMQESRTFYINALGTTGPNSFPEYLYGYIRKHRADGGGGRSGRVLRPGAMGLFHAVLRHGVCELHRALVDGGHERGPRRIHPENPKPLRRQHTVGAGKAGKEIERAEKTARFFD